MERGQFNDALLIAYAAGEVDPHTREAIEAAMARDEVIRARVEAHRRRHASRPASGRVTQSRTARAPLAAEPAEIVDLAAVRALKAASKSEAPPRRAWVQWSALAICVAVGVILARGLGSVGAAPLISERHGELMAQGALNQALDQQIAGAHTPPDQPVRIGVSFRATDKTYCRTFKVMRGDGLAGLACHGPAGWRVRIVDSAPGGSATPPAISASVAAMIEGSPLDARAEAAARAKGWRE